MVDYTSSELRSLRDLYCNLILEVRSRIVRITTDRSARWHSH